VIFDPEKRVRLTNDLLHHNVDYTPYEGMQLTGWPEVTLSRGEVIWRDGTFTAARGRGCFLPCALPPPARADGPAASFG
jgi:dihydropyrimidinase